MNILIADSGSTKTDFRLILNKEKIVQLQTAGMHPYLQSRETMIALLESVFTEYKKATVDRIFFYGTACSSDEAKQKVGGVFSAVFPGADISIEHDLLGAARASCGRNAGLAGILGTGSNCCFFDGDKIVDEFSSSGYILGDEGGGVHLGKMVLKDFIEKKMPSDIEAAFIGRYQLNKHVILEKLHGEDQPNRFLASFSMFIYHHKSHPYIYGLIRRNFLDYIHTQVKSFEQSKTFPLNLVGSVAFYYQDYLREIAGEEGLKVGNILEKPIAGLTLYHTES